MIIRCNECGKEYSHLAPACPNCGAPNVYQQPKSNGGNVVLIVVIAVLVVLIAGVVGYMVIGGNSSGKDTVTAAVSDQGTGGGSVVTDQSGDVVEVGVTESSTPKVLSKTFKGTLAGKNITMSLIINPFNGEVNGTYYYDRYGSSNPLQLTGSVSGSSVNVTEFVDGEYTGSFSGYLNANPSVTSDVYEYSGTMTNSRGNSYKFNLKAVN